MNFIAQKTKIFAIPFLIFAFVNIAAAQSDLVHRLPIGTRIRLRMDAGISSRISSVNDTFTTTVAKPIVVDDVVVLPFGTVIEGRVTDVSSADVGGRNGQMNVRFETIRFSDRVSRQIEATLVPRLQPPSGRLTRIVSILGGTVVGLAIGAASGSKRGILIGATLGAGSGTAVAFLRKGKDVAIRTGEEFEIELKREVMLPATDY